MDNATLTTLQVSNSTTPLTEMDMEIQRDVFNIVYIFENEGECKK